MRKILVLFFILSIFLSFLFASGAECKQKNEAKNNAGSLYIKAGIVLKSGDLKYVAEQNFYLASKSFKEIFLKHIKEKPTLQQWLASKGASKELISVSYSYPYFDVYLHDLNCYGFDTGEEDLIKNMSLVPELRKFSRDCMQLKERAKKEQRKPAPLYIKDYIPIWLYEGCLHRYEENVKLSFEEAKQEIRGSIVGSCQTNFNGECAINGLMMGNYYLTSANMINLQGNKLMWDIPVSVKPGENEIKPSNENLADIRESIMDLL